MKLPASLSIQYIEFKGEPTVPTQGKIITESSVSLTVNGEDWLSFMCTPQDLEALAAGFLFNEGILNNPDEIAILRACDDYTNIDVWLNHPVEKPAQWRRTSGCSGGVTSTREVGSADTIEPDDVLPARLLLGWMKRLFDAQELYRETRGVHCSILTDGDKILASAEDIGRHNTLDKIAGKILLQSIQASRLIILTTGRISSEMLQKSARIGVTILISRTSPTSLSIQFAQELGITLIGYARRNQFNIYAHPERLGLPPLNTTRIEIPAVQSISI